MTSTPVSSLGRCECSSECSTHLCFAFLCLFVWTCDKIAHSYSSTHDWCCRLTCPFCSLLDWNSSAKWVCTFQIMWRLGFRGTLRCTTKVPSMWRSPWRKIRSDCPSLLQHPALSCWALGLDPSLPAPVLSTFPSVILLCLMYSHRLRLVSSHRTLMAPSEVEDCVESRDCWPLFSGLRFCTVVCFSHHPLTGSSR